mmetsp:Transcript_42481/g.51544  ORF Transcript_42481/g.51544 Transcript_42481/m.51544 type:complete len:206 (+) Transcript_42481:302-919(+)
MPIPHPPVGGNPYSSALQKFSSCCCASSSPLSLSFIWSMKRSLCTTGSFNSVYALHTSFVATNSSNRSVRPGLDLCHFARGLMVWGWSQMKVGFKHLSSRKWPTSLSRRRVAVAGGGQTSSCFLQAASKYAIASGELRFSAPPGTSIPAASLRPSNMLTRLKGGVKSIVIGGLSGPSMWYSTLYDPQICLTMPLIIFSVMSIRSA